MEDLSIHNNWIGVYTKVLRELELLLCVPVLDITGKTGIDVKKQIIQLAEQITPKHNVSWLSYCLLKDFRVIDWEFSGFIERTNSIKLKEVKSLKSKKEKVQITLDVFGCRTNSKASIINQVFLNHPNKFLAESFIASTANVPASRVRAHVSFLKTKKSVSLQIKEKGDELLYKI